MKQPPYSLSEAQKICSEFQHLAGRCFDPAINASIDCIAVAPFDQNNRNRFIIYYLLFDDADIALQQDYQGLLFDVIIIAGAKNGEEQLVHEPLHTWLAKNNQQPSYVGEAAALISTTAAVLPASY